MHTSSTAAAAAPLDKTPRFIEFLQEKLITH